jgi:hypothetical protein
MANSQGSVPSNQPASTNVHKGSHSENGIDLRTYSEVVSKRKSLPPGVTSVNSILGGLISFFPPRVYGAAAPIMSIPSKIQSACLSAPMPSGIGKISVGGGQYTGRKPAVSIPTHQILPASSVVLEKLITRMCDDIAAIKQV